MNKKDYVYLCGPMEGLTAEQMHGWRDYCTKNLDAFNIKTLDPCRRKKFHDEPYSLNLVNRIVKMDLQDISNSTVILANLSNLHGGRAWGSVAEIAHGHTKNKIIITIMEKDFRHPFIEFYSTELHYDLDSAIKAVRQYYL